MIRVLIAVLGLAMLTACGGIRDDIATAPEPLGQFLFGHNVVVAGDPQKGPFSRDGSSEDWIAAMKLAVDDRFSRYDGDQFYHIAVAVQGYVLAQPGIPLVYSPKSVLIFEVTIYNDLTRATLEEEPHQITVFEPCCGIPFLGSGLSKSGEEQMEGLSFNAARAIERYMRENGDFFGGVREELADDPTIVEGNILLDNPAAVAPEQTQ